MSTNKIFIEIESLIDSSALDKVIKDLEENLKKLKSTATELLKTLNTKDIKKALENTAKFGIVILNAIAISKLIKLLQNSYKNIKTSELDDLISVLEKLIEVFDAIEEVKNKVKTMGIVSDKFFKENGIDFLKDIFIVAKDALEIFIIERIIRLLKDSFKSLDPSELDELMDSIRKIIEVLDVIEEVRNRVKSMSTDNGNFFKDNILDSLQNIFLVLKNALEISIIEITLRLLRKFLETANIDEYDTLIASLKKLIEVFDAIEEVRNKVKSMGTDNGNFFKDNAFDSLKDLFIVFKNALEIAFIELILRALRGYFKKLDMLKYDDLIAALKKITEVLKAIEEIKNTVKGMTNSNGVFDLSKILGFIPDTLEVTIDMGCIVFLQKMIDLMEKEFKKIDSKKMDDLIIALNKMIEVLTAIKAVKNFIEEMTQSNGVFKPSQILGFVPDTLELTVEIGALTFIQKVVDWMAKEFKKIKTSDMNKLINDLNRLKKVLGTIKLVKEAVEEMTQSNGIFKPSQILGFVPDSLETGVDILGLIGIQKMVNFMNEQFLKHKLENINSVIKELEKLKQLLSSIKAIKNFIEGMTDSEGIFKTSNVFGFAPKVVETGVDIAGITIIKGMIELMNKAFEKIGSQDVTLLNDSLNNILEIINKIKEIKNALTSLTDTDNFFNLDNILKSLAGVLGFGKESNTGVNFLKNMTKGINGLDFSGIDKLLETLSKILEIIDKIKAIKDSLQLQESDNFLPNLSTPFENNEIIKSTQNLKNSLSKTNFGTTSAEQGISKNNITLNIANISNKSDVDYIIEKLSTLHLS